MSEILSLIGIMAMQKKTSKKKNHCWSQPWQEDLVYATHHHALLGLGIREPFLVGTNTQEGAAQREDTECPEGNLKGLSMGIVR